MILEVLTLLGENSKGKKLFDKLSENMASKVGIARKQQLTLCLRLATLRGQPI